MHRTSQESAGDPSSDSFMATFDAAWPRLFEEWKTLLKFRSVSVDPACVDTCRACAQWLGDHLAGLGFSTELLPTDSHPVVMAHRAGDVPGCPSILFYGHYDVQPADPETAWQSPPFEPDLRDGRLYARGAQDNKGQLFAVIKAIDVLRQQRVPLPPMTILLEGDEESGQDVLSRCLAEWRDRVAADILWVSDTDMAAPDQAAMVMGLRGIVTLTVTVSGPRHDLHSGLHGGVAPNPALGLASLLATLHAGDGRIAVRDFYKDVKSPTTDERRLASQWPGLDTATYQQQTGVPPVAGDAAMPAAERLGFLPCIDVNGLLSGYTGSGSKTIIPARAMAKLSARLAAGQDPHVALRRLTEHLKRHAPPGLRVDISEAHVGGTALRVDLHAPVIRLAQTLLRDVFDTDPLFLWEGASIPVLPRLAEIAGAQPVLVGFGLPDDRIHAPDESFPIESFRQGARFAAMFLKALGKPDGSAIQ